MKQFPNLVVDSNVLTDYIAVMMSTMDVNNAVAKPTAKDGKSACKFIFFKHTFNSFFKEKPLFSFLEETNVYLHGLLKETVTLKKL